MTGGWRKLHNEELHMHIGRWWKSGGRQERDEYRQVFTEAQRTGIPKGSKEDVTAFMPSAQFARQRLTTRHVLRASTSLCRHSQSRSNEGRGVIVRIRLISQRVASNGEIWWCQFHSEQLQRICDLCVVRCVREVPSYIPCTITFFSLRLHWDTTIKETITISGRFASNPLNSTELGCRHARAHTTVLPSFIQFHTVAPLSTKLGMMVEGFRREILSTSQPSNQVQKFWNPLKTLEPFIPAYWGFLRKGSLVCSVGPSQFLRHLTYNMPKK
jgi:hypothetical protein